MVFLFIQSNMLNQDCKNVMKKIINYILGIVSLAVMTACAPEELSTTFEGGERTLTLSFTLDDSSSRVVDENTVNYSEVKIDRADIFVYKKNSDGNTYTFSFKVNNVVPSSMVENKEDGHGHFECTAQFSIPSGITFNKETYKIYVVANSDVASDKLSDKLVELQSPDVETLKNLSFTSALQNLINKDTRFIMDGEADVTIDNKNVVSNEIVLTRAAAKIVLDLSIYKNITTLDKIEYQPVLYSGEGDDQVSNIRVSFHNGVNTYNYASPTFFNTDKWIGEPEDATETTSSVYPIAIDPFYTYPIEWEPSSESEPYLMLEIPWKKTDGGNNDYDTYYYRIPVNRKFMNADNTKLALKRNNMYEIAIEVGVLGSTDPSIPVTIDNAAYEIMDWGVLPIDAAIRDYKYLVVEKETVEIFNQNAVKISYKSSDPITAVITSLSRPDYTGDVAGTVTYYNSTVGTNTILSNDCTGKSNISETTYNLFNDCEVKYPNDNSGEIEFSHILINTDSNNNSDEDGDEIYTNDYDYVPYTITIKVTNQSGYSKIITIKQYPAIYAIAAPNSDYDSESEESDKNGYVFINGNGDDDDRNGVQYGTISGLGGNNSNPNMYIINVTNLGTSSEFVIGDPRTTTHTDLDNSNNWVTANKTYTETDGKLENYYPTAKNSGKVIAPIFRIASSHGKTTSNSFDNSQKRCASYQEDGYPAGRWRMPTEAESKFIAQLSANKIIPQLFGTVGATSNTHYWTGSGTTFGSYDKEIHDTQNSAYVRCVYDDWYWGSNQVNEAIRVFTWGDQPRDK